MPRNLLQDMKMKTSRLPLKKERPVRPAGVKEKEKPEKKKSGSYRYKLYLVALISVVFLFFALSFLFSKAEITVTPLVNEVSINDNLSAVKEGDQAGLFFKSVVISGEESKIIPGTGKTIAKGVVSIFNSFSSSPQALDIDTRLQGSNGKIYKTSKKVVVPGMKNGVPGNIEVGIYGGEGPQYESPPIDFSVIGFKGTAKYSKFKVRSVGEIKGEPVVSSLDKTNAMSELKASLEAKLLKKVIDQTPSDFVLWQDAVSLVFDDKNMTFASVKDNLVSATAKGTLYGFLFNENNLAKKIAEDVIDKYDGSEVYIPNIKDLAFSLTDKGNISFQNAKNISFNLKGTPKIVWKVNEAKLVADVIGKKKNDFSLILSQYKNIASAELVLHPFWKTSFPTRSENIKVIVNYPK